MTSVLRELKSDESVLRELKSDDQCTERARI